MILFLWIIGMLAAFMMVACMYRKIESGRLLIVATGMYFSFYVIVSGLLMWINFFSLKKATAGTFVVCGLLTIFFFLRNGKVFPKIRLAWKKYLPLLLVLIAFAFLVQEKAGAYPTGQDEGLYQMRAALYIGGYNDNVVDFPEYEFITNGWEKQVYEQQLQDMEGYYFLKEDGVEGANDVEGVLHGIATFPALLALWGKMFGYSNMADIHTLFYLLAIGNTWLVCENMKMKRWVSYTMAITMGLSPLVLWCAKNTLIEIFLTVLICSFVELLTESRKKKLAFWTMVPMAATCFYHVSISVFIPMVVLIYLIGFLQTGSRKWLLSLATLMLAYAMGFSMMMDTAWHYTMKNFSTLFGRTGYILNENNVEAVVWIAAMLVLAGSIVLWLPRISKAILRKWKAIRKSEKAASILGIINAVVVILTIVYFVYNGIEMVKIGMWGLRLSVLSFWLMSGFILMPLAVLGMISNGKKMLRSKNLMMIYPTITYVLLMYCGVLWLLIYYYYYFARYYAPFMIFILVAAGLVLNKLNWKIFLPMIAVGMGIMIHQNKLVYTERDMTYCDFEVIENIASCIGEKDAILIFEQGYHIQRIFAIPLKGLTGASVYYVNPDALESQIANLQTIYEDIFILQYDLGYFTEENGPYRYVYQGVLETSLFDNYVDSGMPYPKEVVTMESPVALMLYLE